MHFSIICYIQPSDEPPVVQSNKSLCKTGCHLDLEKKKLCSFNQTKSVQNERRKSEVKLDKSDS
jgi:hypothetical protein